MAVFLDYQNVHFSAREVFGGYGGAPEDTLVDPLKIAETIVDKRTKPGVLDAVHVYRGRPSPDRQPVPAAANDMQTSAWSRDRRVHVVRRALRYPRDFGEPGCTERPREKGVDVHLAIDLVRGALENAYDVAVLFSRDTDLLPAVEMVFDQHQRTGASIELATWQGTSRLRLGDTQLPYCHLLSETEWQTCRDHYDYLADIHARRGGA